MTGIEDLSGWYDHVYTERAIRGELLKFICRVTKIFLCRLHTLVVALNTYL